MRISRFANCTIYYVSPGIMAGEGRHICGTEYLGLPPSKSGFHNNSKLVRRKKRVSGPGSHEPGLFDTSQKRHAHEPDIGQSPKTMDAARQRPISRKPLMVSYLLLYRCGMFCYGIALGWDLKSTARKGWGRSTPLSGAIKTNCLGGFQPGPHHPVIPKLQINGRVSAFSSSNDTYMRFSWPS